MTCGPVTPRWLVRSASPPGPDRSAAAPKTWIGNRINFADPVNLAPLAASIIAGIGNLTIKFTSTFSITGIAAGMMFSTGNVETRRAGCRRSARMVPDRDEGENQQQ